MEDITKQIQSLQMEIEEKRDLLANEQNDMSRQELKNTIECKEKELAELQSNLDEADELRLPRRSVRHKVLTEKMVVYQREDVSKREKRLLGNYEQWKILIRTSRENFKRDMPEHELTTLADLLENRKKDLMTEYDEIRDRAIPSTDIRCCYGCAYL